MDSPVMASRMDLRTVMTVLVLVGALNWGTTALGFNLVEMVSNQANNLVGRELYLNKVIYLAVALSAVLIAANKTSF